VSSEDPSTVVRPTSGGGARDQDDLGVGLTIVWHPDPRRVGVTAPLGRLGTFPVSRRTEPFDATSDVVLSRAPFLEVRVRSGGVELAPVPSATAVTVDDSTLAAPRPVTRDELDQGLVFTLADAIVVCLHSVRLPVLRGPALGLVGGSDVLEDVRRAIATIADSDIAVLIRGETGTGKELVARAIRDGSNRAGGPFVDVNMAAIPQSTAVDELFGHERGAFTGATDSRPGYFADAHGGTLFLDEIGATSPDVQKMLLRVLETSEIRPLGGRRVRKVDVRVLAATDEDLESAVNAGRFAGPLFHRLASFQIRLPPLRRRRQDIGPLLLHFVRNELKTLGALDRLAPRGPEEKPWLAAADAARIATGRLPGNARTLRNVARQLVFSSRGRDFAAIDETITRLLSEGETPRTGDSGGGRAKKVTDEQIAEALRRNNYNQSATAAALGINRATLLERLQRNFQDVRSAASLTDEEILAAHDRHAGDVAAMAAELHASPKPLRARLSEALGRRKRS
jgi:two-component system nitrogen regulation response regulator GlnG